MESILYPIVFFIVLIATIWFLYKESLFPIILYSHPSESGAVCLQMIGKYYDMNFNLKELNRLMGRDIVTGISIQNICDAAEAKNLKTLAVYVDFDSFLTAPLPLIIHWNKYEFAVVYKVSDKLIWLVNPEFGKQKYSHSEFFEKWKLQDEKGETTKGVAILFEVLSK